MLHLFKSTIDAITGGKGSEDKRGKHTNQKKSFASWFKKARLLSAPVRGVKVTGKRKNPPSFYTEVRWLIKGKAFRLLKGGKFR